jgi:hypothetical protein
MHESAQRWRSGSDTGARIVSEEVFRVLLDMETRKAQRLRYLVSLVCMDVDGPPAESRTAVAEMVAPTIRATDAVAAQNGSSLAVLLVDADTASLPLILRRVTADFDDMPWSAGGACYPETAASAEELLDQASTMMAQAKRDGGRRLYVQS